VTANPIVSSTATWPSIAADPLVAFGKDLAGGSRPASVKMADDVDEGRGLRTDERNELREEIADIGDTVDDVVTIVRKLKAPEADDLQRWSGRLRQQHPSRPDRR
jgi:hypothetical protein